MIRKFHLGAISAFSTFFTNLVHCDQSYTKEEVSKNNGMNGNPLWITFENKVYDLTNFRNKHPGGIFIDQAAGSIR